MAIDFRGKITPGHFDKTGVNLTFNGEVTLPGVGIHTWTIEWFNGLQGTGALLTSTVTGLTVSVTVTIPPYYDIVKDSGTNHPYCFVHLQDTTAQTMNHYFWTSNWDIFNTKPENIVDTSDGLTNLPILTAFWADFKIYKRAALYGEEHRTADFKAKGENGVLPYRFQWNFGDEASLDDQVWLPSAPSNNAFKYTHTFPTFGPYTVTLRAWDSEMWSSDTWSPSFTNLGTFTNGSRLGSVITMTDSAASWPTPNGLGGGYFSVLLTSGPHEGHSFVIGSNASATQLSFVTPFSWDPWYIGGSPPAIIYPRYRITWNPVEVQHDWMVEDIPSPQNCYWVEEHAGFDGTSWHDDSGGYVEDPPEGGYTPVTESSEYYYFSSGVTAVRYFNRFLYVSGVLDKNTADGAHDGATFLAKIKIDTGEIVWQKILSQYPLNPSFNPPPTALIPTLTSPLRYGWDVAPPFVGSIERLNGKIYLATVTQEYTTYGSITSWYNRPCILILDEISGELESSVTLNIGSGGRYTGTTVYTYPVLENDYGRYLIDIPYLYKFPDKDEFLLLGDIPAYDYIRRNPTLTYRKSWDTRYSAYVTAIDSDGKSKGLTRTTIFDARQIAGSVPTWGGLSLARSTNVNYNLGSPARFRVLKTLDSLDGKAIMAWLESDRLATGTSTLPYGMTDLTAARFNPGNLSETGPYIRITGGSSANLFLKSVFTSRSTSTNDILAVGYYTPNTTMTPARTLLIKLDLTGTSPTYKVWSLGLSTTNRAGKLFGGTILANGDAILYGYSNEVSGGNTIGFFMTRIPALQLTNGGDISLKRFSSLPLPDFDYQSRLNRTEDPVAEFELTDTGICMVTTTVYGTQKRLFVAHFRDTLETGGDCGTGVAPVFEDTEIPYTMLPIVLGAPDNIFAIGSSGSSYSTNFTLGYTPYLGQSEGTPLVIVEDVLRETELICNADCEAPTGLRSARFDLYGV